VYSRGLGNDLEAFDYATHSEGQYGRKDCVILEVKVGAWAQKLRSAIVLGGRNCTFRSAKGQGHSYRTETTQCAVQGGWVKLSRLVENPSQK